MLGSSSDSPSIWEAFHSSSMRVRSGWGSGVGSGFFSVRFLGFLETFFELFFFTGFFFGTGSLSGFFSYLV